MAFVRQQKSSPVNADRQARYRSMSELAAKQLIGAKVAVTTKKSAEPTVFSLVFEWTMRERGRHVQDARDLVDLWQNGI